MATPRKLNPRDELYKLLPKALGVIDKSMTCDSKKIPHQTAVHSSWNLMKKLVPDLRSIDVQMDEIKVVHTIEFK